jgi:Tol biopolymer transport system component
MYRLVFISTFIGLSLVLIIQIPAFSFSQFTIKLVTVSSTGEQANWGPETYAISPEGRYVAFVTSASNLVSNDNNNASDLFLHDLYEQTTIRIVEGLAYGNTCGIRQEISMSSGANFITFVSHCPGIVPGDNNNELDVFVFDRANNTVERISLNSDGSEVLEESQNASITADGRYVAFTSNHLTPDDASNYKDLYLHDRLTHQTTRLINAWDGGQPINDIVCPIISKDGSAIAFNSLAPNLVPNDTNNQSDVFVYNISSVVTKRVSVNNVGVQANGTSQCPSISDDGKVIVFASIATNLVTPDNNNSTDIFLYDLTTNHISRISNGINGQEANSGSYDPRVSGNGRYVTWSSYATNLIVGDTNLTMSH